MDSMTQLFERLANLDPSGDEALLLCAIVAALLGAPAAGVGGRPVGWIVTQSRRRRLPQHRSRRELVGAADTGGPLAWQCQAGGNNRGGDRHTFRSRARRWRHPVGRRWTHLDLG